jgi:hypothetical protein
VVVVHVRCSVEDRALLPASGTGRHLEPDLGVYYLVALPEMSLFARLPVEVGVSLSPVSGGAGLTIWM